MCLRIFPQQGEVECSFTPCPTLECPRDDWLLAPGQCCFTCRKAAPRAGKISVIIRYACEGISKRTVNNFIALQIAHVHWSAEPKSMYVFTWWIEPSVLCSCSFPFSLSSWPGCFVDDNGIEFPVGQIWSPGDPCELCICQVNDNLLYFTVM